MISRDELKSLVDQLPESSLDYIESAMRHYITRKVAEQRFHVSNEMEETGWGGGWGGNMPNGVRIAGQSFREFDNDTLVEWTLQFFDARELELTERLSLSSDRKKLLCSFTLSCGGRTVRHEDEFPAIVAQS